MKRPLSVTIAALVLCAKGTWMIYTQSIHHYAPGAIGDLASFGAFFVVFSIMLYWKVKGWRWTAVTIFILSILRTPSMLAVYEKLPPIILASVVCQFILCAWLAVALAQGKAVRAFVSTATSTPKS